MEYLEDDDKFVWTDASNSESSDSDSSMKNKMRDRSGGEKSENDDNFTSQTHKQTDDQQYTDKKKHRKRKLEQQTSDSETAEPPQNKKIKIEPESDVDMPHNTNKHKRHADPYHEHFLEQQVEEEQSTLLHDKIKSKKKRQKSLTLVHDNLDSSRNSIDTSRTAAHELTDKLQDFVKINTKLKPCNIQDCSDFHLDEQNEVWIIKCPSDVDVSTFQHKTLNMENKCKIKLDGQTYEGNTDPVTSHTSIIVSENGHLKVKNVAMNGYLNLHKRIPKVHMHQDSVMVNNQTDFIPLPETKCRHPLLGSHYKRAMKLPPAVAERLRAIHSAPDQVNRTYTGNAPKSEKSIPSSYEQEETGCDSNTTTEQKKKKKKKKRKQSEEEPAPTTHTKRKKYKLEAADAWDSEQAIENSLFQY